MRSAALPQEHAWRSLSATGEASPMKGVATASSDEIGRPLSAAPPSSPPLFDGGGAGAMATVGRETPSVAVRSDIPESEAMVKWADEDGGGTTVPSTYAPLLVRGEQPRTAPNAFQQLPEAPVFRPSEEQWLDPIAYGGAAAELAAATIPTAARRFPDPGAGGAPAVPPARIPRALYDVSAAVSPTLWRL
eukprot:ctg_923.g403